MMKLFVSKISEIENIRFLIFSDMLYRFVQSQEDGETKKVMLYFHTEYNKVPCCHDDLFAF